jgi:hypothetical protein
MVKLHATKGVISRLFPQDEMNDQNHSPKENST